MYEIFKRALFLLPPEEAHFLAVQAAKRLGTLHRLGLLPKSVSVSLSDGNTSFKTPFGDLATPIGLAAGCDKNGEALFGWEALGFSFVEVGTVTPKPQLGNPKPRVFRYPLKGALVNRLGFNNKGIEAVAANIKKAKSQGLKIKVGGNIGKNKTTPLEQAADDYASAAEILAPIVDYLVINVSSPNTAGLRDLQSEKSLSEITRRVKSVSKDVPIFIKVAPDHFQHYLEGVLSIVNQYKVAGVICGNTLSDHDPSLPQGGLSGQPLLEKNLELTKAYASSAPGLFIIGVGGISNAEQAKRYFDSGASVCQVYTGFVFGGPGFVKNLSKNLQEIS